MQNSEHSANWSQASNWSVIRFAANMMKQDNSLDGKPQSGPNVEGEICGNEVMI
jgi:hypothetical protein